MQQQPIQPALKTLHNNLLAVLSQNPSEDNLHKARKLLTEYYSNKLLDSVEKACIEKGITEQDLDNLLNSEDQ